MLASFVTIILYLHKYYEVGEKQIEFESVMCTGYILKMAGTCILCLYNILMCFAQVYNGMNTYDQVILGFVIGAYLALFFHFRIKIHFKYF